MVRAEPTFSPPTPHPSNPQPQGKNLLRSKTTLVSQIKSLRMVMNYSTPRVECKRIQVLHILHPLEWERTPRKSRVRQKSPEKRQ